MAKNRRTVLKGFSYLQCDAFADYLTQMAAKGWHFKEWGVGLVFEKGEPEITKYAVEVFYKGSQYSMAPEVETLDFADYCEAAGWKLIDSRQKFCIFKQTKADAVPIVTPQERMQNASKAYHKQLLGQLLIAVVWIITMALRLYPSNQLINTVFSNGLLISCCFFASYFLYTAGKYIWFWFWKLCAQKRCSAGQKDFLRNTGEKVWNAISLVLLILFFMAYSIIIDLWGIVVMLSIIVAYILLAVFLSKLRPDRETNVGIQVLFSFMLIFTVMIVSFSAYSGNDGPHNQPQEAPLTYADLGFEAGAITSSHGYEDISLLGSRVNYFVYYEDASLVYTIYESEQQWILDVIWDDYMWKEGTIHGSVVDCAALWNAEEAYYNGRDYLVRYDDTILIFRFVKSELTEEHISIIRNKLGLEG